MATHQQGWRAFVSMWIFTALITSLVGDDSADLNKIINPIVIGATNKIITIRIPCLSERTCQGVRLRYKKRNDSTWKENELKPVNHIAGLDSDANYEVETIVKINGADKIRNLQTNTCPENIPKLTGIRGVKTGPGWLDVRWNPVKENCKSNIYYLVQYGSENGHFGHWKAYGLFNASDGTMIFRPTHPCSTWDAEFCLLLTDHVSAGMNHTVKVKPVRYDPLLRVEENPKDLNEENMGILKNLLADSMFTGPYILGQADDCQLQTRQNRNIAPQNIKIQEKPDKKMLEERKQLMLVPLWAVVLGAVLLVTALTVLIVAWRQRKCRSKSRLTVSPGASTSISIPPACADNTNVNAIPDEVERASTMYDDVRSVHMGGNPIHPTQIYENQGVLSERFRGLQSALQKEIATVSASKGATKTVTGAVKANRSENATTQRPVSDHYLPMDSKYIYDDVECLKKSPGKIYENQTMAERESNMYMEPTSPIYDEAKVAREPSMPYNEVYAHSPENPWRSW